MLRNKLKSWKIGGTVRLGNIKTKSMESRAK